MSKKSIFIVNLSNKTKISFRLAGYIYGLEPNNENLDNPKSEIDVTSISYPLIEKAINKNKDLKVDVRYPEMEGVGSIVNETKIFVVLSELTSESKKEVLNEMNKTEKDIIEMEGNSVLDVSDTVDETDLMEGASFSKKTMVKEITKKLKRSKSKESSDNKSLDDLIKETK